MRYSDAGHRRARWTPCSDFVYYDPWERQLLTTVQYESLRTRGRRQIPVGHPTGYHFDTDIAGWDGKTFISPERDDQDGLPLISMRPYIDFLGSEAERVARTGIFLSPRTYPPVPLSSNPTGERRKGAVINDTTMMDAPSASTPGIAPRNDVALRDSESQSRTEDEVIRSFLRRTGLPDANTTGNATEMMYYLRGRLGL